MNGSPEASSASAGVLTFRNAVSTSSPAPAPTARPSISPRARVTFLLRGGPFVVTVTGPATTVGWPSIRCALAWLILSRRVADGGAPPVSRSLASSRSAICSRSLMTRSSRRSSKLLRLSAYLVAYCSTVALASVGSPSLKVRATSEVPSSGVTLRRSSSRIGVRSWGTSRPLVLLSCLRTSSAMVTSLRISGDAPLGASEPPPPPNRGVPLTMTSAGASTTRIRMVAS
jgi:hypothetical protein